MTKLYIAYGSNLNRADMARRCPTAKVLGASVMKDWRLVFKGAHKGAVATVEPYVGGEVPVLVWEIETSDEKALDIYEGYPTLYRKEKLKLELSGKLVEGMIYIMNDEDRHLGQPNSHYYSVIYEGYKEAGFDVEILRQATKDSIEKR